MKVGIIGFGSIGLEVAKALIIGIEEFTLIGIVSRSKENAKKRIANLKHPIIIYDLDTLIEKCDVLIDCAPKEAFKEIAEKCIDNKKNFDHC